MKRKLLVLLLLFCLEGMFCYSQNKQTFVIDADKINITKTVSAEQAVGWVKQYKNKKWKRHNKRFPIVGKIYDARACWFSIDSIRNYINYLDSLKNVGVIKNLDGIRFYYIAYRKEDVKYHNIPEYKNAHSLLWVATQEMPLEENEKKDCCDSVYHKDILIEKANKVVALASTIMNTGTLCPPLKPSACKGTELLTLADQ